MSSLYDRALAKLISSSAGVWTLDEWEDLLCVPRGSFSKIERQMDGSLHFTAARPCVITDPGGAFSEYLLGPGDIFRIAWVPA